MYWAKIWEPGAETKAARYSEAPTRAILEHQLRLFETLAGTRCEKDLLAIVPLDLRTMASSEVVRRLEACGVRCQSGLGKDRYRTSVAGNGQCKARFPAAWESSVCFLAAARAAGHGRLCRLRRHASHDLA